MADIDPRFRADLDRRVRTRPVRLVLLLVLLLVSVMLVTLFLRATTVGNINADRLTADELDGIEFDERYYPVGDLCKKLDHYRADFDAAIAAEQGLTTIRLSPFTGRVTPYPSDERVVTVCGFSNRGLHENQVYITIWTTIYRDATGAREDWMRVCTHPGPGDLVHPMAVGRLGGCRLEYDGQIQVRLTDDNAEVACDIDPADLQRLHQVIDTLERMCMDVFDELADSRPISYWGNGFWTWR